MPTTLENLQTRFESQTTQARTLIERAADDNRELTEAEKANGDELKRTIAATKEQIDSLIELERAVGETGKLFEQLPDRSAKSEIVPSSQIKVVERGQGDMTGQQITGGDELIRSIWPTPGDYLHDVIHGHQGDAAARANLARALEHNLTTDVPGLVPEPIVGDVINLIDASRPAVASLRLFGMPQYGSSFTRPKIVQHTLAGVQATQKTELASQSLLVDPITVTKTTLGGAVNVSFQTIDWTQPSALNAITTDLADQYAIQTEIAITTILETAALTTNVAKKVEIGASGVATADQWIKGVAQAAAAVYTGCGRLPNVVYCAPDMWAMLIGLTDTTGRPVIAATAPMNTAGASGGANTFVGSVLGMGLVVSPELTSGTVIVAASQFAEAYEDRRGGLRVVEPKLLGWELAYYGYFAGIVTEAGGFVQVSVKAGA